MSSIISNNPMRLVRQSRATVRLQRWIRSALERVKLRDLQSSQEQKVSAASAIQQFVRAHQEKNSLALKNDAATLIQSLVRGKLLRVNLQREKSLLHAFEQLNDVDGGKQDPVSLELVTSPKELGLAFNCSHGFTHEVISKIKALPAGKQLCPLCRCTLKQSNSNVASAQPEVPTSAQIKAAIIEQIEQGQIGAAIRELISNDTLGAADFFEIASNHLLTPERIDQTSEISFSGLLTVPHYRSEFFQIQSIRRRFEDPEHRDEVLTLLRDDSNNSMTDREREEMKAECFRELMSSSHSEVPSLIFKFYSDWPSNVADQTQCISELLGKGDVTGAKQLLDSSEDLGWTKTYRQYVFVLQLSRQHYCDEALDYAMSDSISRASGYKRYLLDNLLRQMFLTGTAEEREKAESLIFSGDMDDWCGLTSALKIEYTEHLLGCDRQKAIRFAFSPQVNISDYNSARTALQEKIDPTLSAEERVFVDSLTQAPQAPSGA